MPPKSFHLQLFSLMSPPICIHRKLFLDFTSLLHFGLIWVHFNEPSLQWLKWIKTAVLEKLVSEMLCCRRSCAHCQLSQVVFSGVCFYVLFFLFTWVIPDVCFYLIIFFFFLLYCLQTRGFSAVNTLPCLVWASTINVYVHFYKS